jgi:hypothetical protein
MISRRHRFERRGGEVPSMTPNLGTLMEGVPASQGNGQQSGVKATSPLSGLSSSQAALLSSQSFTQDRWQC